MKIDIFSHYLPKKYFEKLSGKVQGGTAFSQEAEWMLKNAALSQLEVRLRLMDRYPDVLQVLTLATPPLETLVRPQDTVDLARMANDEMAELVAKYPDKFIAAVACLPLADTDAAMEEADRAIKELHFRGVQLFSNINGEAPDEPKFRPLYERMAQHDLPIWIHPWSLPTRVLSRESQEWVKGPLLRNMLGWPFETSVAMVRLAIAGILDDYPGLSFITHHCGGMVSFFERRLGIDKLRRFYNDTALYGNSAALMCGYAYFGADHLVFGTDMPLGSGALGYGYTLETIRSIKRMNVPDEDKGKIFEHNARRLLKLPV